MSEPEHSPNPVGFSAPRPCGRRPGFTNTRYHAADNRCHGANSPAWLSGQPPRRGVQPISNVVTPCAMAGTAHFVSRTTLLTLRTPFRIVGTALALPPTHLPGSCDNAGRAFRTGARGASRLLAQFGRRLASRTASPCRRTPQFNGSGVGVRATFQSHQSA